jgi:hypothetical protein
MRKASSIPIDEQHEITWATPSRPMCSKCFRFFRSPSSWRQRCSGLPKIGPAIVPEATMHRHNVAVFAIAGHKTGILAICLRCAAYSQHHVCNLRKTCPGHLGTRANALKRILRGLHPTDKRSYVQAPLRPWPYVRPAEVPFAVPSAYTARSASQPLGEGGSSSSFAPGGVVPRRVDSTASSTGPSSIPLGAHGEGDPHNPVTHNSGTTEEWDLEAPADLFGDD